MGQKTSTVRIVVAAVVCLVLLVFLRFHFQAKPTPDENGGITKPTMTNGGARETLTVAFLPVTCHLTCPVTDYASKTSTTGTEFDAQRFVDFPTIAEALKSKKLLAGFVTVPLAMKMREQGAPIRICCLGHRDGSQLVVRKDLPAKDLHDLRGKTIAIPSKFSNENFFMVKLMADQGMKPGDINFVVLNPPDMVVALASKQVDGFIVAEPFCGKTEMDGTGRVLYYTKDLWPNYISCCLVVHEDLIRSKPEVVRDLVRGINDSGAWTDAHRQDAAKLVAPYFVQNVKLLTYILTQPPDRVLYSNLNPTDAELQKIMDMGISLGFLKTRTPMSELIDRSFVPAKIEEAKIDMNKMAGIVPKG